MKTLLPLLIAALLATPGIAQHRLSDAARTPLRFEQTAEPYMPSSLLHEGITEGHARIAIRVTADGALADTLVTGYSDPRLSTSALNALKKWHFTPATVDGEPVGVITELHFTFEGGGVLINVNAAEALALYAKFNNNPNAYAICTLKDIDRIPVPLNAKPPYYPKRWKDEGIRGSVEVEFFIDETGNVRMPHLISADHIALADIACEAVTQWKFEPPTRQGQAVAVRARQQFTFGR